MVTKVPSVSGASYDVKTAHVGTSSVSQYTAAQIQDFFSQIDPGAVADAAEGHMRNAAALSDIVTSVAKHATKIGEAWQGDGASSALSALEQIHTTATVLHSASKQVGQALTSLSNGMKSFKGWTAPPLTLTASETQAVAQAQQFASADPAGLSTVLLTVTAAAQERQNQAAQAQLAAFNNVLVSANTQLPQDVSVNPPPAKSKPGSSGSGTIAAGGGGSSAAPTPSVPTPSVPGSTTTGSVSSSPPPPVPTPAPPGGISLQSTPPPLSPPSVPRPPAPTAGPTQVQPGGPNSGPSDLTGQFTPNMPFPGTPSSTSGGTLPPGGTPAGQNENVLPADEVLPANEAGVGDFPVDPGGMIGTPGGVGGFGTPVPGDDVTTQGGFAPGLGNGVGDGLTPVDGGFGLTPGDSAVMGPDGVIGVPGQPAGGFGAFTADTGADDAAIGTPAVGEPAFGGGFGAFGGFGGDSGSTGFGGGTTFAGGEPDEAFTSGGMVDGTLAESNPAVSGVAGAGAGDGAGVGGYGYPMTGGSSDSDDEKDRYRQSWLNEDAELWADRVPLTPSLIGR